MPARTIYPIFLPHAGCPFQCVYCNQKAVTAERPRVDSIRDYFQSRLNVFVEQAAKKPATRGELAFYGGTFTAIAADVMRFMLDAASPWVERGVFAGIRFSTRPDRLGPEICRLLADYPVRTVELGVQSLVDEVLLACRRGYPAAAVTDAVASVRAMGWDLGIQLMLGLPGDQQEKFLASVFAAIDLKPDFVRLYPTLVLPGTVLADWHARGRYQPLPLDEAIDWCTEAYAAFVQADIPVARMGLHADPTLQKPGARVDGPYHPAFGYLVKVNWWRRQVDHLLTAAAWTQGKRLLLHAPERCISEVVGPERANVKHWLSHWGLARIEVKGEPGWVFNRFEAHLC